MHVNTQPSGRFTEQRAQSPSPSNQHNDSTKRNQLHAATTQEFFGDNAHHSAFDRTRPPISMIVINGTPDLTTRRGRETGGFFVSPSTSLDAERHLRARSASLGSFISASSSGSTSTSRFKLVPRNGLPFLCSPSQLSGNAQPFRGRKRQAQSMSSPNRLPKPAPENDTTNTREALSPLSPTVERALFNMNSLSLMSPVARNSLPRNDPFASTSSSLSKNRGRASSFSLYLASPSSAGKQITTSSSSPRTASSSARSSPRLVPLTVLTNNHGSQLGSLSGSPPKPPRVRPPFHVAATNLLCSLESEAADAGTDILTPQLPPESINTSLCFCTVQEIGSPLSLRSVASHLSKASSTTLPKVTLTPRTALCQGPSGGLPRFPSPSDDVLGPALNLSLSDPVAKETQTVERDRDSLLQDFTYGHRAEPSTHADVTGKKGEERTILPSFTVNSFAMRSRPSLTYSMDGNHEDLEKGSYMGSVCSLQSNSPPSFLENPSITTCEAAYEMQLPIPKWSRAISDTILSRCNNYTVTDDAQPEVLKSTSLLAHPSRLFNVMMEAEARAGVLDAENGSLSDSDSESFMLASPTTLAAELQLKSPFEGRARQRRRYHFNTPLLAEICTHSTMTSLAMTPAASNTSLYGMDIVHEDAAASTTPVSSTPFSHLSSKAKASGSSGNLSGCFGGFDNCLQPSERHISETGRDLVTPPITVITDLNPPPLARKSEENSPNQ